MKPQTLEACCETQIIEDRAICEGLRREIDTVLSDAEGRTGQVGYGS